MGPEDAILGLSVAFNKDAHPQKVNLGVGAYRTEEGKPYVLPVVKEVEEAILANPSSNHEYLPIDGHAEFCRLSALLLLGEGSKSIQERRVATIQTLSGTGSLRLGAEFIAKFLPGATIYLPIPTWGNHPNIFIRTGIPVAKYRYFDFKGGRLDIEGLLEDLEGAQDGSVILLHACAHNPTGCDPTNDQWMRIADVFERKRLFPYFDCAYQGFATGNIANDAWAVRHFDERGFEMLISQSYAKNMGLYGERIGALSIVARSDEIALRAKSQLRPLVRVMYSNPPVHGAKIVHAILSDPANFEKWEIQLKGMADRIISMRQLLVSNLKDLGTPGDWSHIVNQIGMFSFTGLSEAQVDLLINKYHIYLTKDGRISMAGINSGNVRYLAEAIHDAVTSVSS